MSNARFSILQARAISDKRISDAQFRTLASLGMYADREGWCFPSLTRVGADCNKSKQAAGRDIIHLKNCGYVEVYPQFDKATGSRKPNKYRLKFDPPVNVDDSTPSTPDVDAPSTPDVDVNVPINDPKNSGASAPVLTADEYKAAGEKTVKILAMANPEKAWRGREVIRPDLLHYADWYHEQTGQIITRQSQAAWMKALPAWKDEGLEIEHLQAALDNRRKYRTVSSPVELTIDAAAIKAAGGMPKPKQQTESAGYYA